MDSVFGLFFLFGIVFLIVIIVYDFLKLLNIIKGISTLGFIKPIIEPLKKLKVWLNDNFMVEKPEEIDEIIEDEPVEERAFPIEERVLHREEKSFKISHRIKFMFHKIHSMPRKEIRYILAITITLCLLYLYTAFALWNWDFTILKRNYGAYPSLRRELGLIYIVFLTLSICITFIYNRIKPPTKKQ